MVLPTRNPEAPFIISKMALLQVFVLQIRPRNYHFSWPQKIKWYGGYYYRHRLRLEEIHWYIWARIEKIQLKCFMDFLNYAPLQTMVYARQCPDYGFDFSRIKSLDEFQSLLILYKYDIRAQFCEIIFDEIAKLVVRSSHTSGSRGHDLRSLKSKDCFHLEFRNKETYTCSWPGILHGRSVGRVMIT